MEFKNYSAEDFALLKDFRDWVINPDKASNLYWGRWLEAHPDKIDVIVQARKLVENLPLTEDRLSEDEFDNIVLNIEAGIDEIEHEASHAREIIPLNSDSVINKAYRQSKSISYKWMAIAASVILLIGISTFFYKSSDLSQNYITQLSPLGQKIQINLPDGSRVWLNAGSSITYPEHFTQNERNIELHGEGYFEVAHDTSRPFRVKTGSLTTTALGTSFNISHYENENQLDISLITGKVRVVSDVGGIKDLYLIPGERAHLDIEHQKLRKTAFDTTNILNWKNGIIYFEGANYAQIEMELERWYGVEITSELKNTNWRFYGKFDNESLKEVLDKISITEGFTYEITNNTVKFHP